MRVARVSFGGVSKEIHLAYTPEAAVGNYVLAHVGFAIGLINESEARRAFAYLKEIEELEEAGTGDEPDYNLSPEQK